MNKIENYIKNQHKIDFNNLEFEEFNKVETFHKKLNESNSIFNDYYFLNNPTLTIKKNTTSNKYSERLKFEENLLIAEKLGWFLGNEKVYLYLEDDDYPTSFEYSQIANSEWTSYLRIFNTCSFKPEGYYKQLGVDCSIFNETRKTFTEYVKNKTEFEKFKIKFNQKVHEVKINKENERKGKLKEKQQIILLKLDKDKNGEVDLIDGETFNILLTNNQKSIIEIDKNYIQKFVKISVYLKTKKSNTQRMFESIHKTRNTEELNELVSLLKNQIHTYELLVFHSISMITSLVESDLITFYEIYESFDQLGVFNSNWENEVSNKLSDIGDGIKDLMYSINRMELNIVNSLETLTYVTKDSFNELNSSISSQLSSIDSSINFNNLLTGIQTYQMYKINQNTKKIN